MMPAWLVKLRILLLLILFSISMSYAQTPLDLLTGNTQEAGYELPQPSRLSVKWWQEAIKKSPQEQPFLHLNELATELEVLKDNQDIELSNAASQSISQFKNNLMQLTKLNESETEVETTVYEKSASYSLSEIYAYKKQIRSITIEQKQRQEDITALRDDARFQYQAIDTLIVRYRDMPPESLVRLETGIQWIELRSWMALYEKQADLLENKFVAVNKYLSDLKNHFADAVKLLKPDVEQIPVLEQSLEQIEQALINVNDQVQSANLKITTPEEDTLVGGLMMDIKKLELANHLLEQSVLELEKTKTKAHLDWINSNQPGQELDDDEILEHANQASSKIAQAEINQLKWRALAQDILISPTLKPDVKKSRLSNEAASKRSKLAQDLLLGVSDLDWRIEQVSFIEGLLTKQVIDSKSGLNRIWAQVKSYSTTAWLGFEGMANKPLFKVNETPITLMPLLRLIIIVLIGYLVSKFIRYIIRRVEARRQVEKSSVFFILDKLIHYIIILVATLAGFTTLGIDFTNITLIAGALSVGIGFGLQNIVSNFVSGLTIMFERSLKVGDYIEMEDGLTGSVMEINARSTRINTNDNIDVVIPNSDLVTNKIINWTLRDSIKRVKIPFGVAYGTDKELVRKAAIEAAENVTYTLTNMKGKEPEVWMTGFGDNSLNFVLLVWVSKYGVRRPNRIKASFLWELDTAFNKYNIEIPFPQRVLHYANGFVDVEEELEVESLDQPDTQKQSES